MQQVFQAFSQEIEGSAKGIMKHYSSEQNTR